jgi:putative tricarboxylic transport membrane protein
LTLDERKGDLVLSGVLCAVGGFVIAEARAMPYADATVPGPGFLPMILGVMLCGVSLALMVKALLRRGRSSALQLGHVSMIPILLGLILLAALMERAGFVPMVGLFVFMSLVTLSSLRWWISLLWSVFAASAAYGFFHLVLGIPLPHGTWWLL